MLPSHRSLRLIAHHAMGRTGPTIAHRSFHLSRPNAAVYPNADIETLNKVLVRSQGRIVLVDFYADWCLPCRQLSPILEKLASENNQSSPNPPLDLVKINTETTDGQELGTKHEVRALPTVIAYKDGQEVNKFVGALPEPHIKKFLESL